MKTTKSIIKQTLLVFALMIGAITALSILPDAFAASGAITDVDRPGMVVGGGLRGVVLTIINYFLGFLGLLAVIMIIYGGVTYVISAGKDESVGNAKKIITYSIVGIIIILLSFVIVNTVLSAGEGVEPT